MSSRFYQITEEKFNKLILPIIVKNNNKKFGGRPPKISHYKFFSAVLYILRTGNSWRDCPEEYGNWHTIYTRFNRWSENGLLWLILYELSQSKLISINCVFIDSTTVKLHRHGSGSLKKKESKV